MKPPPVPPPALSVVIPVHNREHCLRSAVDSVQAQDIDDWEIVCVNDASTDGSAALIADLSRGDPRIRSVTLAENHGTGYARKTGIREAHGRYILCLDADDRLLPNVVGKLLSTAEERDLDVLQFQSKVVGVGNLRPGTARYFQRLLDFHLPSRRRGDWRLLRDTSGAITKIHWVVWNKLYRAEPLKAVSELMDDGWYVAGEDVNLTIFLYGRLPSYGWTRLTGYEYRCGTGSVRSGVESLDEFRWKCNRADCCRELKRVVDAESERLVPGLHGDDGDYRFREAPRDVQKQVFWLNRLCTRMTMDRMELTWRQMPPRPKGPDTEDPFLDLFISSWRPDLCRRFFWRGVALLHSHESITFRLGAWELSPITIPLSWYRKWKKRHDSPS